MVHNSAHRIRPAHPLDLARVLATVLYAGLPVGAVPVVTATHLAVPGGHAGLFRRASRMGEARKHTPLTDAFLADGTLIVITAEESTLAIHTGLVVAAVFGVLAEDRHTQASAVWIWIPSEP